MNLSISITHDKLHVSMVARCSRFWSESLLASISFLFKHWAWALADPSRHKTIKMWLFQTDGQEGGIGGRQRRQAGWKTKTDRQIGGEAIRWAERRGWGQAGKAGWNEDRKAVLGTTWATWVLWIVRPALSKPVLSHSIWWCAHWNSVFVLIVSNKHI